MDAVMINEDARCEDMLSSGGMCIILFFYHYKLLVCLFCHDQISVCISYQSDNLDDNHSRDSYDGCGEWELRV